MDEMRRVWGNQGKGCLVLWGDRDKRNHEKVKTAFHTSLLGVLMFCCHMSNLTTTFTTRNDMKADNFTRISRIYCQHYA